MFLIILIVLILIVGVIVGLGAVRANGTNYRNGAGLFKSSEFNLDEKEDISDKTYYNDRNDVFR